jgi:hypothetical protein
MARLSFALVLTAIPVNSFSALSTSVKKEAQLSKLASSNAQRGQALDRGYPFAFAVTIVRIHCAIAQHP